MKVDLLLSNALVYDIQSKVDIKKGETFTLIMDDASGIKVFADQDSVLQFTHTNTDAVFNALALGESEVQFQDASRVAVKVITIRVVDDFVRPTTALNITADPPVQK